MTHTEALLDRYERVLGRPLSREERSAIQQTAGYAAAQLADAWRELGQAIARDPIAHWLWIVTGDWMLRHFPRLLRWLAG